MDPDTFLVGSSVLFYIFLSSLCLIFLRFLLFFLLSFFLIFTFFLLILFSHLFLILIALPITPLHLPDSLHYLYPLLSPSLLPISLCSSSLKQVHPKAKISTTYLPSCFLSAPTGTHFFIYIKLEITCTFQPLQFSSP